LYYRLAVVERLIPNLEQRGSQEKIAIFCALLEQALECDVEDIPQWVLEAVGTMRFNGNVRELANLVERVAAMSKQFGPWESVQFRQVLERFNAALPGPAPALPERAPILERPGPVHRLRHPAQAEPARILPLLDTQHWRRQDTAAV